MLWTEQRLYSFSWKLLHIWFDGGALPPNKGGPDMLPLLHKFQPNANVFQGPAATVRWVGNEEGVTSYPCWATTPSRDSSGSGDPEGKVWLPGECDVPLPGHEWFWTPNQRTDIEPLPRLLDIYYRSVGRNCNVLLNATPGPDGLIPEANLRHYMPSSGERSAAALRRPWERPAARARSSN